MDTKRQPGTCLSLQDLTVYNVALLLFYSGSLCLTYVYLLNTFLPLVQIPHLLFQSTGMNLIFPYEKLDDMKI